MPIKLPSRKTLPLSLLLGAGVVACGQVKGEDTPDAGSNTPPDTAPVGHDLKVTLDGKDAAFVAIQDGDGAFTKVVGAQQVYRAHLAQERYGVAVGCNPGNQAPTSIVVIQNTVADGLDLHASCGAGAPGTTVNLTVGLSNFGESARVQMAGSSGFPNLNNQVVLGVAPGFHELFVDSTDGLGNRFKFVRLPAFDVTASQTINVDVAAQGTTLETQPVSVVLPPGAQATLASRLVTSESIVPLRSPLEPGVASYIALPAVLRRQGDLYDVTLDVNEVAGAIHTHRSVTLSKATPAPLTFTLSTAPAASPPVLIPTPALHPKWSFTASGSDVATRGFALHVSTPGRDWSVVLSPSYLATTGATTYEMPDLSAQPDFAASFALTSTFSVPWSVERLESTAAAPADNRITRTAATSSFLGCGNGIVEVGEACDTAGDSATCDGDCSPVVCGDGYVNPVVEQCDPKFDFNCGSNCIQL